MATNSCNKVNHIRLLHVWFNIYGYTFILSMLRMLYLTETQKKPEEVLF